ncbi:CpaF family protein [Marinobacter nauticus]|uniref:CpaF family protein n=1 Tax=Marinobacter nauticus TaxID=2743 RepID=UPI001C96DB7C|nr:CpaF family protein [Marinobacter nauticus]MBY5937675.1 CpaF family protein [Marinobacter nauticus]MBY5954903.1 CpaF family protein [Marinobacter nauticus]MBY6008696.1 CpaF family protein [Marinobacter nauticus]MBY6192859.1 CpaF family protein [Marinobacter nauticus]MBY6214007.1 CpaF family protein [Marinobacter nauticus]
MANRIDDDYQLLKKSVHTHLIERLDEEGIEVERAERSQVSRFIQSVVEQYVGTHRIPMASADQAMLVREMVDEVLGFGPLEPLLADDQINDILINGAKSVFVEISGVLQKVQTRFIDDDHVIRIIRRILAPLGRRLDESSPMVDARLPDGSRVNAIIPPIALDGPSMSIRKFSSKHLTANELVNLGSMTRECLDLLSDIVESRRNLLVSGGTGTGKTTILNLLSEFIPSDERIVTIEDSAELQLNHPHIVRLETRPANTEGTGRITARDLIVNALRMRPDRVIVGEVRSGEIIELLQAMNTGHEGSMSTIHSNSAKDALIRIETLLAVNGYDAGERAIARLIGSSLDVVVQLIRLPNGRRLVSEVVALQPTKADPYHMETLYRSPEMSWNTSGEEVT